jgi:hypothetical protein
VTATFAPPNPLANCLKTGTAADIPRVPEDAITVNERAICWYHDFRPQNEFHAWMVDQIVITSLRIEHNGRIERRHRDRSALRAETLWDHDRRQQAEEVGAKLAANPSAVVGRLRETPQGCDWLIRRWAGLARAAELDGNKWDDAQRSLAFDLLGAHPEARVGRPGEVVDDEGRLIEDAPDPASLARREVAALQKQKENVDGQDTLDRLMAQADMAPEPTEEVRRLRRYDAELHRRLKWYVERIDKKSPYGMTSPRVYEHFDRPRASVPQPAPEPEPPAAQAQAEAPVPVEVEPETEPGPEVEPVFETDPPIRSARLERKARKSESRREARLRKLERRRA